MRLALRRLFRRPNSEDAADPAHDRVVSNLEQARDLLAERWAPGTWVRDDEFGLRCCAGGAVMLVDGVAPHSCSMDTLPVKEARYLESAAQDGWGLPFTTVSDIGRESALELMDLAIARARYHIPHSPNALAVYPGF